MCGIAGLVGIGDDALIRRMTDALRHRGPDGEGHSHDPRLGVRLGHRRLAIVDIDHGAQPMPNEDGSVVVTYNGELYDTADLRRELESAGHRFSTDHSDTEILVHGWEEWGERLPERLEGMFAFAILDRTRGTLFLARDRFGEKPLLWSAGETHGASWFAFASELSALRLVPEVDQSIDRLALRKYFAYGYLPAPWSIARGVRALHPGGAMRVDLESMRRRAWRWWELVIDPDRSLLDVPFDTVQEQLRDLLRRAVRRRLVADVPLGVFLSGGVDSSAIAALAMEELDGDRLQAFTIGFNERSYDESSHAAAMVAHLQRDGATVDHTMRRLDLEDALGLTDEVLSRLDEPLGDPSVVPTHLLSKVTREKVTVALSGDGGDELLAGYDPVRALRLASWYARLVPGPLHRLFRAGAGLVPRSDANMSFDFRLRRLLMGLSHPPRRWNPAWMAPLQPDEIAELFAEPVDADELFSEAIEAWETCPSTDPVDRTMQFFGRLYLPDDILRKSDRASMLTSLEVRAPFLDGDLVEFLRRLPAPLKYRRGITKLSLRLAMRGRVPESLLWRKKKGFGIPTSAWINHLPEEDAYELAQSARLESAPIRRAFAEHRSRRGDHRLFLWCQLAAGRTLRGA